jgi:hypothetical protein
LSVLAASGDAVKIQYSEFDWQQYVSFAKASDASAGRVVMIVSISRKNLTLLYK